MSKVKTTSAAVPVPAKPAKSLGDSLRDNWQLYVMLLVPVLLTVIYKYVPMYGIQTTRPAEGSWEAAGWD